MSLRRRRRIARLIDKAYATRRAVYREWVWALRDLRDFRRDVNTYLTLTPQPKRRDE